MNRILAMLLVLSMLLSFVACAKEEAAKSADEDKKTVVKKEDPTATGEEETTVPGTTLEEPTRTEEEEKTTEEKNPPSTPSTPSQPQNPGSFVPSNPGTYVPPSGSGTGSGSGSGSGSSGTNPPPPTLDDNGDEQEDITDAGASSGGATLSPLPYPVESYPTDKMTQKLTHAQLDAIPIANDSMSSEQLRKICTDYFELQLSFHWTPNQSIEKYLTVNHKINGQPYQKYLNYGSIYGGIPYQSVATGNLYRWFEYYDEKTGIWYLSDAIADHGGYSSTGAKNPGTRPFFNQCSVASFWGWGRVINSANFIWTADMNVHNGFIPVGFFTYNNALTINRFGETTASNPTAYDTINVIRDWNKKKGSNGMYQCYAQAQPGDLLVSSGHAMMIKSVNVNPSNLKASTMTVLEQIEGWGYQGELNGVEFKNQGGVNRVYTFEKLQSSKYIPFTFAEFHKDDAKFWSDFTAAYQAAYGQAGVDHVNALKGSAAVEPVTFTVAGKKTDMKVSEVQNATITCNYVISDLFFTVKDPYGKVLDTHIYRTPQANYKSATMNDTAKKALGNALKPHADGRNTLEVYAQVSTGEKLHVMTVTIS